MKRLLVDKCISDESVKYLNSLGFSLIFSTNINQITNSTSTHPDMQFIKTGNKKAIVASQSLEYYKSNLPDFEFTTVNKIKSPYPYDTALNFVILKNTIICTKFQYETIGKLDGFEYIFVNQGYTKCSICVLNDNAVITGDMGIVKTLENSSIKAYYLLDKEIKLSGYKNGFWGGASGLVDKKLYFNGNIEKLSCYQELLKILDNEKIEPIYHKNTDLYDNGSIILLD